MSDCGCPVWGSYKNTVEICPESSVGFHAVALEGTFGGTYLDWYDSEGVLLANPIEREGITFITTDGTAGSTWFTPSKETNTYFISVEIKNPDQLTVTPPAGALSPSISYAPITTMLFYVNLGSVAYDTMEVYVFYVGTTEMKFNLHTCHLCE